jgi:hypothetical protein
MFVLAVCRSLLHFPPSKGGAPKLLDGLKTPISADTGKAEPTDLSWVGYKSELDIKNNTHCTHPSKCLGTTKQGKFVTALSTFDDGANRTLSQVSSQALRTRLLLQRMLGYLLDDSNPSLEQLSRPISIEESNAFQDAGRRLIYCVY